MYSGLFGRMRESLFVRLDAVWRRGMCREHFGIVPGGAFVHLNALEECYDALGLTGFVHYCKPRKSASRSESRLNFK